MVETTSKSRSVTVDIPDEVYQVFEQNSARRGMTTSGYITALLVTHDSLASLNLPKLQSTEKKPKYVAKDPIKFPKENLISKTGLLSRHVSPNVFSDGTLVCISVGNPVNIYDLMDITVADYAITDVLDRRGCKITSIVLMPADSDPEIHYTEYNPEIHYTGYSVVPATTTDPQHLDVMLMSSKDEVLGRVTMDTLKGDVIVTSDNLRFLGVIMQFRMK